MNAAKRAATNHADDDGYEPEAPTLEQVRERLKGFKSDWAELTPVQRLKFAAYDGPLNGGPLGHPTSRDA